MEKIDDGYDFDIMQYVYFRFFDFNTEIQGSGMRFNGKEYFEDYQKYGKDMFIQRKHPIFGKCVTFRYSDKFRKNGLYYLYTYK